VNSVTWTQLVASNDVQRQKTSKKELDKLRAVIARDFADASQDGVSADRRFATAYKAALKAAKMAIACAGLPGLQRIGCTSWQRGDKR
jgi:hypothetical protein